MMTIIGWLPNICRCGGDEAMSAVRNEFYHPLSAFILSESVDFFHDKNTRAHCIVSLVGIFNQTTATGAYPPRFRSPPV